MLKLSTKSRYAVRILVHIALNQENGPVRTQSIAKNENISSDYVEQILSKLKLYGLVNSFRGVHGGFATAKEPAEINIADIIHATEGEISIAPCLKSDCATSSACITKSVWERANEVLYKLFREINIASLAKEVKKNKTKNAIFFEI